MAISSLFPSLGLTGALANPKSPFGRVGVPGAVNDPNNPLSKLSEEEQLRRKKKLLAAGTNDEFQTATQFLFGNRLNSAGTPMV